jgi:LmbE family N-acetylglucosaminyl deacetylase
MTLKRPNMQTRTLQKGKIPFILALLISLFFFTSSAKVYLFIHAHPDDELYFKSGWIYDRIQQGDTLIVVIATAGDANKWTYPDWEKSKDAKDFDGDGDIDMVDRGYDRMAYRSTPGLASLGLDTDTKLIFLGYADGGIFDMWENPSLQYLNPLTGANTSPYSVKAPRYSYGLSYKEQVPYTYSSLSEDIKRLLITYKPDCIMVPDFLDTPSDHGALGRVATQALYDLRANGENEWVNKVEVIWSFPSHFVWDNKDSWLGGTEFQPNTVAAFLAEPFPQDIYPPQVNYWDKLGAENKCALWRYHPYEMPNPPCFRSRKNDMIRGPFVMYDDTPPTYNITDFEEGDPTILQVKDAVPGLNTTVKSQYIYSTDGGKNWSGTHGLKGFYRNKNNKVIYHNGKYKNRPESENYSYWQGDVALSRVDAEINFEENFNTYGQVQQEYWSAEWIGWIKTVEKSGIYHFYFDADDSGFLMVNDQLLVWDHGDYKMGEPRHVSMYLEKNQVYPIHLGFWNYTETAGCKLSWKTPGSTLKQVIPSGNFLCGDAELSGELGTSEIQKIKLEGVKPEKTLYKFLSIDMAGNIGVSPAIER